MIYAKDLDAEGKKKFWDMVQGSISHINNLCDTDYPDGQIYDALSPYLAKVSIVDDVVYQESRRNSGLACSRTRRVSPEVRKKNIFVKISENFNDCISSFKKLAQNKTMNDEEFLSACRKEGSRIYTETVKELEELKGIQNLLISQGLEAFQKLLSLRVHKELVFQELGRSVNENCEFAPLGERVTEPYESFQAKMRDYVACGKQTAVQLTDLLMKMELCELMFIFVNNQHVFAGLQECLKGTNSIKDREDGVYDLCGIRYIHSHHRTFVIRELFKACLTLNKDTFSGVRRLRIQNYVSSLINLIYDFDVFCKTEQFRFPPNKLDKDENLALASCKRRYSLKRKLLLSRVSKVIVFLSFRVEMMLYALKFVEFVSCGLTKVDGRDSYLFKQLSEDIRLCGAEVIGLDFLKYYSSLEDHTCAKIRMKLMSGWMKALRGAEYHMYYDIRANFDLMYCKGGNFESLKECVQESEKLKIVALKTEQIRKVIDPEGDREVTVSDELPECLQGLIQEASTYSNKRKQTCETDQVRKKRQKSDEVMNTANEEALDSPLSAMRGDEPSQSLKEASLEGQTSKCQVFHSHAR